jgi:flagellar protein FliS
MTTYGLAKARYASDAAQTVSPARLVTMLYDRLVVDLVTAEDAMRSNDVATLGGRLGHAQEILLELHATLDLQVWPEGEPLSRLYLWMVGELMQARLSADPQRIEQCRMLVEPLRDAWHEVATGRPFGGTVDVLGGTLEGPGSTSSDTVPAGTATPATSGGIPSAIGARYVITSVGAA